MEAENRITTLTEREKQALRSWLEHKTAKEIALDLGVSHHAVEKRLKMARTKLGVASSLEAARTLAEAERMVRVEPKAAGYGQTVTGSPDLPPEPEPRRSWYRPILAVGGFAMIFATFLALAPALLHQTATAVETPAETRTIKLDTNMAPIFDKLDENGSGYLEQPESPFVDMAFIDPARPDEQTTAVLGDKTDSDQIAAFYAEADTDGDRRVSFREFHVWNSARLAELGIDAGIVVKFTPVPES